MPAITPAEHPNDPRFVFFSTLLRAPVLDASRAPVGRLVDLAASTGEPYPPVETLFVRSGRARTMMAPWTAVDRVEGGALLLRPGTALEPAPERLPPDRLRLAGELLDRQIVDVEDAKLVRVNDLHFLDVKGQLRIAHVDVGFRGLVRRMGWERAVDGLVRALRPGSGYLHAEQLLSWKLVQPLDRSPGRVRLEVAQKALAQLHPADLAEIMEDLNRDERAALLSRLDVETAADALEEAPPEITAQLLEDVPPERAADILEEMQPDEAADVLGELPQEAREELLEAMERPEASEVQQLLGWPRDSAGGLMTPDRLQLEPGATVADALAEVRRRADELPLVYEIFLTDRAGKLTGVLTLRDLVLAEPTTPLHRIAREPPATVEPEVRVRAVAGAAAKYNLVSVPVVDRTGVLLGMVTVDDILAEVLDAR
ncbi:MAG TPA: CBS domain-containing protein [Anaeromyxobacteraceae bacterium]|nr:CBS domain-containing protein [Anaeromyxobacteraceae bacterium]